MEQDKLQSQPLKTEKDSTESRPWVEPKLTFIEPKLTRHGELQEVTGQSFFGSFVP
jgi:hypothetical protein